MGKRGPKKGQGGRPRGGKHPEEQRSEWRLRKIKSERKRTERKKNSKQLKESIEKVAKMVTELEQMRNNSSDVRLSQAHTTDFLAYGKQFINEKTDPPEITVDYGDQKEE